MGPDLILEGGGVRLRPMAARDADDIVRWRNEPSVAQQMFGPPLASREAHLRWFEAMRARGDRQEFIVEQLRDGGPEAVGTIGLSDIDRRHRRADYGILLGEARARGQGVARAASALLLDYAFGPLGLERVFLQAYADNAPALALYRRLGFMQEGVLRRHAYRGAIPQDVVVMGILKEEWLGSARRRHEP